MIKEQKVPDDVICTYQPQPKKKGEKDKQIYLGSPGFACQKLLVQKVKSSPFNLEKIWVLLEPLKENDVLKIYRHLFINFLF